MQIRRIVCREVSIPLKFRFSQSNNPSSKTSSSIILELETENDVSGYGECCPRSYVTGESVATVIKDISNARETILSSPCTTIHDLNGTLGALQHLGIGASTLCAVELAFLDLFSNSSGQRLPEMLDCEFNGPLFYSLVLPLLRPESLAALLSKISFFKPPSIKLKVDADINKNLENISRIRSNFGNACKIRLDINGGWALEEAKQFIATYLDHGIDSFEQILDPADLEGMRLLTKEFGNTAQIMVDEALLDVGIAQYLIENKIGNHFNLKVSKLGGIFKTVEIYRLARENGIPCQLGSHYGETSILTASGIVVAGMAGELSAMEGALGTLLLEHDVVRDPIQMGLNGKVDPQSLFQKSGLSGDIDPDDLETDTLDKTEFGK